MSRAQVVIFDEHIAADPLADYLINAGYDAKVIDPNVIISGQGVQTSYDNLHALIYEPHLAMRLAVLKQKVRPTLDNLIQEAIRQKAKIAVLTGEQKSSLEQDDFLQGPDYAHFIQKPERLQTITGILGL